MSHFRATLLRFQKWEGWGKLEAVCMSHANTCRSIQNVIFFTVITPSDKYYYFAVSVG